MLADFYFPRLLNDMKIAVQKNHLRGQILYRSMDLLKKRRLYLNKIIFRQFFENQYFFWQKESDFPKISFDKSMWFWSYTFLIIVFYNYNFKIQLLKNTKFNYLLLSKSENLWNFLKNNFPTFLEICSKSERFHIVVKNLKFY